MPKRIRVTLAPTLRDYSSQHSELDIQADTLQSVLEAIQVYYPNVYECVCNETGRLRPHIHVFINSDLAGTSTHADLHRSLSEDDVLTIWTAVSGG